VTARSKATKANDKRGRVIARCWVIRLSHRFGTYWWSRSDLASTNCDDAVEYRTAAKARRTLATFHGSAREMWKVYRRGKRSKAATS